MNVRTRLTVGFTFALAAGALLWGTFYASQSWLTFFLLLTAVLLCSGFKVALPRGDGSMSLNFPFLLLACVQLSPEQAMLMAALSAATQCRFRVKKVFTAIQVLFNIACAVTATAAASATYAAMLYLGVPRAPALGLAALAYFVCSTGLVAQVIAASTSENVVRLWLKEYPWYLPFYFVGAILAQVSIFVSQRFGWLTAVLMAPMVYTIYRSYNGQIAHVKEREQHLEETEALHLRTIEGLSMAIEAKDQNTHDHLFRVGRYVKEVGERMGLTELEMRALHTASFLHDIGKLAVPEHIINKPGRLSPEEFDKMKIHPVVGADILERVRFPYPVVPIVRSHHEWWDGSGYPDGLAAEQIPLGARVLSAVDCFDAMTSDRPYRRRISYKEALEHVRRMAGKQFDPAVISVMEELYANSAEADEETVAKEFSPLRTDVEVWRGAAPGAGFEVTQLNTAPIASVADAAEPGPDPIASLQSIAAASQEAQALFEMNQSLGASLSLNETLSVMSSRLRALIPFDTCALYVRTGETVALQYIDGLETRKFNKQAIAFGEGISGWVAQSGKAILNGNAAVETIYQHRGGELQAALSIPLCDLQQEVFAVLTLYATQADSFERDHLRILQAMSSKLSLSLQNAIRFHRVETHAFTDFLTGLPNARQLFVQLEQDLGRARASGEPLSVVVCDLNSFKRINDLYGHTAGNRVLGALAEVFGRDLRPHETVARMGGDEFVFVLPNTPTEQAECRSRQIRAALRHAGDETGLHEELTASLGMVHFPADGTTAEELLASAERRMYLGKRSPALEHLPMIAESGFVPSAVTQ